ncbi:MAG: hypothetical protein QOD49_130, partial [Actinomycetota bacterium]|nr:hypothetical protein [Actinomycetota bacterium]
MCVRPVGHGSPGRAEWRRIAGWEPAARRRVHADQGEWSSLAGKAASNSSAMPGLPSSPGASNSAGDDARVRWQDTVLCVPVPRVPCSRGCSRRCCPGQPSWPRPARCRSSGSVPTAYGTHLPRNGTRTQPGPETRRGSKRNGITSRPATGLAAAGHVTAEPKGLCGPGRRGPGRPDAGERRAAPGLRRDRR